MVEGVFKIEKAMIEEVLESTVRVVLKFGYAMDALINSVMCAATKAGITLYGAVSNAIESQEDTTILDD